jgi:hypothetical protein
MDADTILDKKFIIFSLIKMCLFGIYLFFLSSGTFLCKDAGSTTGKEVPRFFCGSWLPFQWNLTLFGASDAGDACAITLLLKIIPFLIIVGIVASLAFCGG